MNALILAAGQGRRLRPYTCERPKCLLRLGSQSILQHQLERLEAVGVDRVVVVAGFGLEAVRRHLVDVAPELLSVRLLYNPFYAAADNLISLWAARAEMDDDFLILNGDNAFHAEILSLLAADARPPCQLLVKRKARYSADDMKVCLDGNRLGRIGKDLPAAVVDAASVGIMRFTAGGADALRRVLEEAVRGDDALRRYYVDCLQRLVDAGLPVGCLDVGGRPWIDIDTPEDLRAARADLPRFGGSATRPTLAAAVTGGLA